MDLTKETQIIVATNKDEHVNLNGHGAKKVTLLNPHSGLAGSGLNLPLNDHCEVTYPTTSSELYTFSLDGDEVATLNITYSDDTFEFMTSYDLEVV